MEIRIANGIFKLKIENAGVLVFAKRKGKEMRILLSKVEGYAKENAMLKTKK